MKEATIVWFRQDLRVADNPAIFEACRRGGPVIPLFIWAPEESAPWSPGEASQWFLHHCLTDLQARLAEWGTRLVIRRGPSGATLRAVAQECGANAVYWNRLYEPAHIKRDTALKAALKESGLEARSFNAALLFEPGAVLSGSGTPYKVFTPFWRRCMESRDRIPEPFGIPAKPPAAAVSPSGLSVDELDLLPRLDWAKAFPEFWSPGERGATEALERFLNGTIENYHDARNRPDKTGTSRLSPHLHFGTIGPRQIYKAVMDLDPELTSKGHKVFLSEIGWREFSHQLLFNAPNSPEEPLRPEFAEFPWRDDPDGLKKWQTGMTGYPIVDAGMRELWATGWMHNRVRMIAASFLIKDLMIPWQAGEAWFWDTLVDADLAANVQGWQWTAGCGSDAAPYYRVFNPVSQGRRFDPEGDYVRRWIPELSRLPKKFIHAPWEASAAVLEALGITLGTDYPEPMVDHAAARLRALEAFKAMRSK